MKQTLIESLAKCYPYEVQTSEELVDALWFTESPHDAETIVRAGFAAGIISFFLPALLLLVDVPVQIVLVVMVTVAIGTIHTIHTYPQVEASFARIKALGQAPDLVGRIVLRMKIQPAIESALRFAVETDSGLLAKSLDAHIERSRGTPKSGLLSFASYWADDFPALRRSAHLISTAPDAARGKRERTLERALTAMLDGTRNQMAEFTNSIRGPVTGLYAFGVMLPLALVSMAPAISAAGIPLTIELFVVLYDIVLPVTIVVSSVWLLARRPVAFPPPAVTRGHSDIETHWLVPVGEAVLAGALATAFTRYVGPSYLAPISGIGVAIGTFLYRFYKPVAEIRSYIRDVEEHLIDALYIVGRQVDDDESVESAIETASKRVPGATGNVFEHAVRLQLSLHLTVEEAFLGEYGALNGIQSPRAHATAELLSIAAEEGQPAGKTIVSMADHLEELLEVERHTKRQLSKVTGTLQNTASFFGPLVAGATVALATAMVNQDVQLSEVSKNVQPLQTDQLGIVIGIYVLFLCLLLQPLSIGLKHGLDRPLIGYQVGQSLLIATPVYVLTVYVVGIII